jgi:hypothetical protein
VRAVHFAGLVWGLAHACLPAVVLAATRSQTIDPRGRPPDPVNQLKLLIWHDEIGWHIKARGVPHETHRWQGTVHVVRGKITSISGYNSMEVGKREVRDLGVVNRTRDTIAFTMQIGSLADAFQFTVDQHATAIVFNLSLDGGSYPQSIAIGANGINPGACCFTLPAHPGK